MIRYSLRCEQGHDFDGWFRSSDGFDSLRAAGQVACTICGSVKVEKALMAPRVAHGSDQGGNPGSDNAPDLHTPRNERENDLRCPSTWLDPNRSSVRLRGLVLGEDDRSRTDAAARAHDSAPDGRPRFQLLGCGCHGGDPATLDGHVHLPVDAIARIEDAAALEDEIVVRLLSRHYLVPPGCAAPAATARPAAGTPATLQGQASSTTRFSLMLCSAARTMRRLFTAASMESDRSMSSLIALRKNSCSRSQRSW